MENARSEPCSLVFEAAWVTWRALFLTPRWSKSLWENWIHQGLLGHGWLKMLIVASDQKITIRTFLHLSEYPEWTEGPCMVTIRPRFRLWPPVVLKEHKASDRTSTLCSGANRNHSVSDKLPHWADFHYRLLLCKVSISDWEQNQSVSGNLLWGVYRSRAGLTQVSFITNTALSSHSNLIPAELMLS